MDDNELFELCKEVYEKTGWGETDSMFYQRVDRSKGKPYQYHWSITNSYAAKGSSNKDRQPIPLYTSDYLLEKLPSHIKLEKTNRYYAIWLDDEDDIKGHAFGDDNSPLKALLKLTLALHEAGELS